MRQKYIFSSRSSGLLYSLIRIDKPKKPTIPQKQGNTYKPFHIRQLFTSILLFKIISFIL